VKKKTAFIIVAVLLVVVAALAGTFRRYRIVAASDAPSLMPGDFVVANSSAYDLRVPFARTRIARVADPGRGDMVICRMPRSEGREYVKRVVGLPGDEIEIRLNRLHVNGVPVELEKLDPQRFQELAEDGSLGQVVALERGAGPEHLVTYTPGRFESFGPVTVREGEYFLMGDNRDNSLDSRQLGTIPRDRILGKVVGNLTRR